jgi:hypothetical protein
VPVSIHTQARPAVLRGRLASIALGGVLVAALLPLAAPVATASTPVTAGYRDFNFGASAGSNRRATGDKPQSKLWYTDGYWWAGMFNPEPTTKWKIYRLDASTQDWVTTGVTIDDRDQSHADYLWDELHQNLYVASAHASDNVRIYRYSYNATTNTYTADDLDPSSAATYVTIQNSASQTVTIARDSRGQLWITFPSLVTPPVGEHVSVDIMVATTLSDDNAGTLGDEGSWTTPFELPTQGTDAPRDDDLPAIVAYGSGAAASVGIIYTAEAIGTGDPDNLFFTAHLDSADEDTGQLGWGTKKTIVTGVGAVDNHVNIKVSDSGRVFAVFRTGKHGSSNLDLDQIDLVERDPGTGNWAKHRVSQVREDQTRPIVVVDDEHDAVYTFVAATEAADGGKVFMKTASFDDLDADGSGTSAFGPGTGATFISSSFDLFVNDPTSTKQAVSHATGVVVLASDRTTHVYLHNGASIASTDTTPPAGTVSINGGAAITTSAEVTLDVPATDLGSSVKDVLVTNNSDCSSPQTFAYAEQIAWTLSGADGTKTVCVKWRDTSDNLSAGKADTIVLDVTAPPAGAVTIAGGAAEIGGLDTSVGLTKPSDVTDITHVRLSNDNTNWTILPFAASVPWRLASGSDGPRTVWAEWRDGAGHWSASDSDAITVNSLLLAPPAGTVKINNGAKATKSTSVTLTISKPAADVTKMRLASSSSGLATATWINYASTKSWTVSSANGTKRVYVQWRDSTNKVSPAGTDSILLDRTRPTASAPKTSFATGRTVGLSLPALIGWSGSDALSGVRKYTLYRSINGGSYQVVTLPTATTRSIILGLSNSKSYRFAVKTTDWAGNASLLAVGPLLHPRAVQENSSAIHYSTGWHTANSSSYFGGHDRYSTTKGAKATYRLYGRGAAIVSALGPTRGSMGIYVDGVLKQTISLYSAVTRTRRVVARLTWSTLNYRTVTIRVVGTTGHSRVDLDALLVMR